MERIPNEYFFAQRSYPTGNINNKSFRKAIQWKKETKSVQRSNEKSWEFIGPTNTGGRLTCVEALKNDPNTIYVGAASGGIFKTEDRGQTWDPIFDDAGSLAIGDLAIAAIDQDIIYAGTGESNAGGGSLAYDGDGIYRSADGGSSWENIGLKDAGSVGRVVIHPDNPDHVYVATMGYLFEDGPNRGVFRTQSGGEDWERVLFLNDSTGAIDLAMHPGNPDILYAAMWERVRRPHRRKYGGESSGVYRSIDGGNSWSELQLPTPNSILGRIGLAVNPTAPDVLAVYIADGTGYTDVMAYSTDMGENFEILPMPEDDVSYNWWFGRIGLDPHRPGDILRIGLHMSHYSILTSNRWERIFEGIHVDQHDLFIHPEIPGLYYVANDGGLYISENNGADWQHINNLPITQFYTCEIDPVDKNRHYGGSQDNGSNRSLTDETNSWQFIFGGDGFVNIVDPRDNRRIYVEYQFGNLFRSDNDGQGWVSLLTNFPGGQPKNWNTPVLLDPLFPEILYYGTNRVWKSTNRGENWEPISPDLAQELIIGNLQYGTVSTISVSTLDPNIIIAGTDNGKVWVTYNGGNHWQDISSGLPDRWITSVAIDPFNTDILYTTLSGFRNNDYESHIYKSFNQGNTWTNIGDQIPDIPINKIIVDPIKEGTYYIATDIGVFISEDEGVSWSILGQDLPNVPVTDIDINTNQQTLLAATYGRSMFTYDLSEEVSVSQFELSQVNIFPQPSSGMIRIESREPFRITAIFNSSGIRMEYISPNNFSSSQSIDISNFSPDIYFIEFKMGDLFATKKIIKI